MPSLSQVWGVNKGSNSPTSRHGFSPFSRKSSSAASRGRQHLRTKSVNGVHCGHSGTHFPDISKRTSSPAVKNGQDFREPYESKYDRYRQIYLATSPERELSTLNAAIVNVRKWLKKKHQCLQSLKQQTAAGHEDELQSPLQSPGSSESPADNRSQPHGEDVHNHQALLEKLVTEAGHQQEAVDVLLDRGRRYLQQRACITLEVDLDNLAFLWNSYTKQLFLLHDQPHDAWVDLHSFTAAEGKENVFQHSTPVKWRKGAKLSAAEKLHFSDKGSPRFLSVDENGTSQSVSSSENLNSSFAESYKCDSAQSLSRQAITNVNTQKEDCPSRQPSNADVTQTPISKGSLEAREEKENLESRKQEAKSKGQNGTSPVKTRRTLPQVPPSPQRSSDCGGEEPEIEKQKVSKSQDTEQEKTDQKPGGQTDPQGEKKAEDRGEKKRGSPQSPGSPRSTLIAASHWPPQDRSGWLRVAGEGIFTASPHQQPPRTRVLTPDLPSHSDPDVVPDLNQAVSSQSSAGCEAGSQQPQCAAEGWLGKRGKEIHNEQQQKQEREQQRQELIAHREGSPQNGDDHASPKDVQPVGLHLQLGLSASEENLKMEIEEALKEIQGCPENGKGDSLLDLGSSLMDSSANDSTTEASAKTSDSDSLDDPDLPTSPKRRRMNADTLGSVNSGSGSPLISGNSSVTATPSSSPAGTLPRDFRQRYELWKAIEPNYQYLMDKEIIETCQSTETALTGEEEEVVPNVSFTEFLKQYQELIDWLNQTQRNTQRTLTSLSEKYLNQTYHEEMLEKCPRQEFLTKYSQQLLACYPNLYDQVTLRMTRLNAQWASMEKALSPQEGDATAHTMRQDLECDLATLRRWLNATESRLLPLTIRADWTDKELEERLQHHQVLQQDIESHSCIVSAVLKLSELLERQASCSANHDCQSLQLVALNLERRWHGIWLQSLEWQCRLEEAINRRKGLYGSGFNFSGFTLPTLDESAVSATSDLDLKSNGNVTTSSNGSLIELSDDSLLFIGTRTEHHLEDSTGSGPASPGESLTLPLPSPTLASPKLTNFLDRSSGDSANISECESKMGDSPQGVPLSEGHGDLSGSMSGDREAGGRGLLIKVAQEAKDIGYSSESQSNDETENMQQQIALECRYPGIIEVCSDGPLGEKMTLPAPGAVRQDYYCMTHVDLDSTDKTTTDDGNTTDDKENQGHGGGRGREVQEKSGVAPVNQGAGGTQNTLVASVNCVSNLSPRGSHEDIAVKSYLESSDEVDGADVLLTGEHIPPCSLSESDSVTDSQEKIRYLIDHAEDLVKSSPRSTVPGSPQRKMSPSKQTQTVMTEASSVESSCDASSENSDESGNEEFSTATDDADDTLFDSVINLDSTMDSLASPENVLGTNSITVDSARLRKQTGPRGGKKDRPWSVAGIQGLKPMEFQPLSTSESAIDRMRAHTDTDSSSCQFLSRAQASTFPRRERHRGYQRAFSACEQSSPRATKRKLKYSSSSSATDSQASRSSATQVAVSTDEDDRTFTYDSAEQLHSSQGMSPCVLESESETTDEYVTASMDEAITSADEDPHNSTGSFSENAWDNYQMMYPTASEDATEEMLHWEPVDDMEFEDDFNLTFPKQSSLLSEAISKRANKMRMKAMRSGDDSDSDMEDFRSVLEDSELCLKMVDQSLKKKRNNPMGSGLACPGKYAEMLATCETNMDCVKNVCQHLTQEDIGIGDVQRVQELLHQWKKLHGMASDRHQQSQQLAVVGDALNTMKTFLTSLTPYLTPDLFTSKEQLFATINTLKVKEEEVEKQRQVLEEHKQVIRSFRQHHPSVNVTRYMEELGALDTATADMQLRVSSHLQSLQTNFAVWYEYLEGQQELDTLMAADRDRLYTVLAQREAGHRLTKLDVLKELETLQNNLSVYESKLSVLQALRQRLMRVSDDQTQRCFLASLADLRNQLHVVSQRCRQMFRDMEEEEVEERVQMNQAQFGQLAISPASLLECDATRSTRASVGHYHTPAAMEEGGGYQGVRQGQAWSWLRSVPVQVVALMMVAGLLYVLDPDLLSHLSSFSLTVNPELRHENGPSGL